MGLSLPEELSPYTDGDNSTAGAYALRLGRPLDLESAWEQHYDTRPPYWDQLMQADSVLYVGGTSDLLSRLEDHRNNDRDDMGSKRAIVLTKVCSVAGLHTAWVGQDYDHATEILEPRLARWLQQERPNSYVHQR